MRLSATCLLVALAIAAPGTAQEGDLAERRAVASDILDLTVDAIILGPVTLDLRRQILQQIEARQPDLRADKRDQIDAIVQGTIRDNIRAAATGIDLHMADTFTLEELEALRDFYDSPVGQSITTKLLANMMPGVFELAIGNSATFLEALRAAGVEIE